MSCIWDKANANTKLKLQGNNYVNICKTCDSFQKITYTDHAQTLGNCDQTILVCNNCSNEFVTDDHQNYEWYLEQNSMPTDNIEIIPMPNEYR